MIYVIASSEPVYVYWCHDRGINPRDRTKVRRIREQRDTMGLRAQEGDEFHVVLIDEPTHRDTYRLIQEMHRCGFREED
jgi:hypothetical protein